MNHNWFFITLINMYECKLPENMLLSVVAYSVVDYGPTTWLLYHESDIVINIKIFFRCSTSNSRRVEHSFANCCTYQFLYEIWNDTYAGTVYHYTLYTFLKCDEDLNKQKIIICTNYHTCLVSCLRNRNIFLAINRMLCHIYMYILYTSHIY